MMHQDRTNHRNMALRGMRNSVNLSLNVAVLNVYGMKTQKNVAIQSHKWNLCSRKSVFLGAPLLHTAPSSHHVIKCDQVSFQRDWSWWLLVTAHIYSKQKLQTSRASHGTYGKLISNNNSTPDFCNYVPFFFSFSYICRLGIKKKVTNINK